VAQPIERGHISRLGRGGEAMTDPVAYQCCPVLGIRRAAVFLAYPCSIGKVE
jgi:hypothetical protein